MARMTPGAEFRPLCQIYGPSGRAHLDLPCGHQAASLNWHDQQPGMRARRTCRTCRRVFSIRMPTDGSHKAIVIFVRQISRRPL